MFIKTTIDGEPVQISSELLVKYDQALPRYTSYPTAPVWHDNITDDEYRKALTERAARPAAPMSLYIHLPFCSERCAFCACNVIISKKRHVIDQYLDAVSAELATVGAFFPSKPLLAQLHLGGGTPNYLDPPQMERLLTEVKKYFLFEDTIEASVEADPRWTNTEKIAGLRTLGINRLSFGVQDIDPVVQQAINRVQPFELVQEQVREARRQGFESVNIDLIYGLPFQNAERWAKTLNAVAEINPDRIALFNFAYVPWLHVHHQKIAADSLPMPQEKMRLFTQAIDKFNEMKYDFIGMDHFARKTDELSVARREQKLHRNFQGYTTRAGLDLIGFGVTAIGDIAGRFFQNERKLVSYERTVTSGKLATSKGYVRTRNDELRRSLIMQLFCHQKIDKRRVEADWKLDFAREFAVPMEKLQNLSRDGLVRLTPECIEITALGRLFIRNVAAAFDQYLGQGEGKFSRAV
ncbi:MAG: oxygen-independent coproporphyrinogen III oxidase [Deltaproteobacteria bacterium]|nr:oxygen-independent coproporphyrinogen III oxidase [Deltaproteobacteria bacterium]